MYSVLKCFEKRILLEDAAVNTKQNSNKHVFSTNDFLYVGVLIYHIPTPIRAPTYPHSSVPVLNKTINNRTDAKNESRKFLFSYCVTIPLGIWELLMALRQQQVLHSGVPDREQPIFTDPDGHVPHPDSFTRHLRKLYKKCGLSEDYHLHTLRHFYATYLLQEGTSKQVAASLLGHADTAFLERTYCHPQDVAKRQAANLMQDLLNNQNPCYVAFMKNRNRKPKKAG